MLSGTPFSLVTFDWKMKYNMLHDDKQGGDLKVPSVNFSVMDSYDYTETPVGFFEPL